MKKTLLLIGVLLLCLTSAAFGYYEGSNMKNSYPAFKEKMPYAATQKDAAKYAEKARNYIDACNNDIKLIQEMRDAATEKSNAVVQKYNQFRSRF